MRLESFHDLRVSPHLERGVNMDKRSTPSHHDIRFVLIEFPGGPAGAYAESIFNLRCPSPATSFFGAFMWVMSTAQPLTSEDVLSAIRWSFEDTLCLASEITESQLLHLCNNLLVLDSQRKVWRFSHLSVVEYFENNYWTRQQAGCYIAKTCLSCLLEVYQNPEAENEYDDRDDWLRCYSRDPWIPHVQTQEEEKPDPMLRELLNTFLGSPKESSLQYQRCFCNANENLFLRRLTKK